MCTDWPGRDEKEAHVSDSGRRPALLERQPEMGRSKDGQVPERRSVHVDVKTTAFIHYVVALCNYNPTPVWILVNFYSTSS